MTFATIFVQTNKQAMGLLICKNQDAVTATKQGRDDQKTVKTIGMTNEEVLKKYEFVTDGIAMATMLNPPFTKAPPGFKVEFKK